MLKNEKYVGDVLMQKTFVADVLTKQSKKNNGELPQYYISNNHPAIIDRDVFNMVQEEISRRASMQKTPGKNAKTAQSKYSGKYALNEALMCAECGTPYRRATWTQYGQKRVVWRCISRLEHGKKFCKTSPTLDETELHAAIMDALGEVIDREPLLDALSNSVRAAQNANPQARAYIAAKRRIAELDAQFNKLLELAANAADDADYIDGKFREISEQRSEALAAVAEYESTHEAQTQSLPADIFEPFAVTQYDESLVRQLIDTIKVHSNGTLQITLKGGEQIERQISTKQTEERLCATQQYNTYQSMS
jgi:hypothetical protein